MTQYVSLDGPNAISLVRFAKPFVSNAEVRQSGEAQQVPLDVRFLGSTATFAEARARREEIQGKLSDSTLEVVIYRVSFSNGLREFFLSRQSNVALLGDQFFSQHEKGARLIGFDLFLVPTLLLGPGGPDDDEESLRSAVTEVLGFGHGGKPSSVGPK